MTHPDVIPFTPSDAPFWADPWIGAQLLAAHLDDRHEAASRAPAVLDRAVAHLVARGLAGPGVRVLDLGCGPGLVSTRLAAVGCEVTGVDINRRSLAHARATAGDLPVTYREQDFRTLDDDGAFDLVLQSYGELATFDPDTLDGVLGAVHRALRPAGALVFDMSTPHAHPPRPDSEESDGAGFWRPHPHRVRESRHHYPDDVCCDRYEVTDETGTTTYRMWFADRTPATLEPVLARAGFAVEELWGSLAGDEYDPGSAWFAVLARRTP
ncbi:methyltransferase domain-containing protein [Actinotalea sp. M2MS4P-6]|uniref:class I SAM-dependent methyltransferase n=1 Tax=Actinotalea sp. M2MS4P-6 TaxID=2983762 RepID=UPI0021E3A4AE|nr:class I SAM-dependent methyltransferase [Actinotalea sp. M2MS4P-6]MCV2395385.1 methyltransferase domain-containing protein [Actinotalea sp. M2MS4P-6]